MTKMTAKLTVVSVVKDGERHNLVVEAGETVDDVLSHWLPFGWTVTEVRHGVEVGSAGRLRWLLGDQLA